MAHRSLLLGVLLLLAAACGSSSRPAESTRSTVAKQQGPPVHARGQFLVEAGGGIGVTKGRLFLVDAASGRARLLADDPDLGEVPRWSPDGTHVLSASFRGKNEDLISYPVAGGGRVNLTATKGHWEYQGRWSPDGTRIAYLFYRGGTDNDLYVARTDGSDPRRVARHADGFAWSPDGRRIAYDSSDKFRLLVVPALGGRSQPLGPGGSGELIDWGPKGQVIYEREDRNTPTYLWTRTGDTSLGYVDAQFLPDGTVAFGTRRFVGFVRPGGTTDKARLVDRPTSYSWSTDGRYLAFVSAWNGHVYVAHADGTGVRLLPTRLGTSQIEVFGWRPNA